MCSQDKAYFCKIPILHVFGNLTTCSIVHNRRDLLTLAISLHVVLCITVEISLLWQFHP